MSESDLVTFLRARLGEDEATARKWATPGNSFFYPELAARVFREVDAKRKILAESERYIMDDSAIRTR